MAQFDSLMIGDHIELLGGPGGVPCVDPACAGAVFSLQPGYDLGAAQPTVDILAGMLLDGERPFGRRASNRTLTIPIYIHGTSWSNLAAALEVLMHAIDSDMWQMTWTRAQAADPLPLPLIFDCFRAGPASVSWGGVDTTLGPNNPIGVITLTVSALPYGRANVPVVQDLAIGLSGNATPPSPITLDTYANVPGNFLTGQNSGFDGGLGGWSALTNCTIATSTAQAHTGPMSMAMTSLAAGDMQAIGPSGRNGLPVQAGQVVTIWAWYRSAVSARACSIDLRWYDVNGNFLSQVASLTQNDSTSAWTQVEWLDFFVAPANGYAAPVVHVHSTGAASEVHYVDDVLIGYDWHGATIGIGGSSAHWQPSLYGDPTGAGLAAQYLTTFLPQNLMQGWQAINQQSTGAPNLAALTSAAAAGIKVGDQFQIASNFLTGQNTGFEGGIGTWVAAANCAIADSAAQAHTGADSLSLTSTAAGNMSAQHCSSASVLANGMGSVTPGGLTFASSWFRTAVSARSCQVGVLFFDAAGNVLNGGVPLYGATVTDSTSGWVQATATVTAPAQAEWGIAVPQVLATGGASEVHYTDDVVLGTCAAQVYAVTSVEAPFFGISDIVFFPSASFNPLTGAVLLQTGPVPLLGAITTYLGLGSTNYYRHFCQKGGRVRVALTLTDNAGNTVACSRVQHLKGSRDSSNPKWWPIRLTLPSSSVFNYAAVTGYQMIVTNRETTPGGVQGPDMAFADVYLTDTMAVSLATSKAAPQRGVVYDLAGMVGTARTNASWQFQQQGTPTLVTKTFTWPAGQVPGTPFAFPFTAPPGVTSVSVFAVGGGGADALDGAGGGGGSAANASVGVTPGLTYYGQVGAGGYAPSGGTILASSSFFTGDSVTVTANPGAAGHASGAGGAGGAAGTGGFAGGSGGTYSGSGGGAPGGGGSAGSAANGNAGAANSGATGGAGGAAVTSGGAGGTGANNGVKLGSASNGQSPGGGGGGAGAGSGGTGGNGAGGIVTLSYVLPPTFKTLIAHRPSFYAPDSLCPFVSPSSSDVPNGSIEYPVPSLIPGVNARFALDTTGLTYSVILVNNNWNNPTASRTLTVTVKTYEQPGGNASSVSIGPVTVTPSGLASAFVRLGELTLPQKIIPPDNLNAYHTVTITDSNTADTFLDVLFLDTQGTTVIAETSNGYINFFVDEPDSMGDIGVVSGSAFDRADAISVLDVSSYSGPPLGLDPYGNQSLLVYAVEGAPAVEVTYFPKFFLERTV